VKEMRIGLSRGQVLILTALTISFLIISTQIYLYQRSKTANRNPADFSTLTDYVLMMEQSSRHVVIASLINVSNGGAISNFENNLNRWESFVAEDYQFGRCDLNATEATQSPYSDGVWLGWGADGKGISSAYADFTMNLSGRGVEIDNSYGINGSTIVLTSGFFFTINQDFINVTVTINILNENEPALASNITVFYKEKAKEWLDPRILPDYSWSDFGNGTYRCFLATKSSWILFLSSFRCTTAGISLSRWRLNSSRRLKPRARFAECQNKIIL